MTVTDRVEAADSGHLAVLGHRMLASVSVVVGALETLREGDGSISSADRALLEAAVERSLTQVADAARSLIRGEQQ